MSPTRFLCASEQMPSSHGNWYFNVFSKLSCLLCADDCTSPRLLGHKNSCFVVAPWTPRRNMRILADFLDVGNRHLGANRNPTLEND